MNGKMEICRDDRGGVMTRPLRVLELFAGTRSISKAFEKAGHETYSVEWDKDFENITLYEDINNLTAEKVIEMCGGVPDVIWASPDCFTAGTLVWTDRGYVPIEDIRCKDMVLTHTGSFKKVYRTIKKNTHRFIRMKVAGVEEFLTTPNHPFYVRKKVRYGTHKDGKSHYVSYMGSPEWVNAEDLTTEYRVGIPINTNAIIPEWGGAVRTWCNKYGPTRTELVDTLSSYMDRADFWRFVGLYFADGSISKTTVTICCEKKQEEVDGLTELLNGLGWEYSKRETDTAVQFNVTSFELCEFLLQFGKGAKNKQITPAILDLPVPLLREFLEGYLSGDGHVDTSTKNPQWKYTTVSRNLAYGLNQCILKAYNRYPSVIHRKAEVLNDTIEGRKVEAHDSYICGFYIEDSERLQYEIEDGMAWVNIKDVEPVNTPQQSIYTLSVEDDESYTVFNLSVHNCTTYSIAAISHHRERESDGNLKAKSEYAAFCDRTNKHVLELIKELNPTYWFIENPRGGMRKMNFMRGLPRYTVTYCQYGDTRMKPTDIWTNHLDPKFKPACKNGDSCHVRAPRGARTGTQGIKGARDRSRIPEKLCEHIVRICEERYS